MPLPRAIRLRGVAVHNLCKVDLDLPLRRLIAICGVSGSGKTSLALDTLYAEGQRRYIESFSPYTRQFLEQLEKPAADSIDGIPPAIAVTHKNPSRSNRATVGTATELNDYLALAFARLGSVVCYQCGQAVRRDTPESMGSELARVAPGTRMMLGFDVSQPDDEPYREWLAELVEQGYVRAIVEGVTRDLTSLADATPDARPSWTVILDRVTAGGAGERLQDSIESALAAGHGQLTVYIEAADDATGAERIDGRSWQRRAFSTRLRCDTCGLDYIEPEPQLFNFNRPLGACPECEGFGNIVRTDMERVVPDRSKSLREGAIAPWNTPAYAHELAELLALADDYGIPVDVPVSQLSEQHWRLIERGVPERDFGGLRGFFRWLERRKYKMHLRVFLGRWRSYYPCPTCGGTRLNRQALAVRLGAKNFAEVLALTVRQARNFFSTLELSEWQRSVGERLLADVVSRLSYLEDVGVGYLALSRPLRTLSNGEAQRVALTVTLGSNLVDMLYVLDEPSVGLHPANVAALADAIARLRDRGNTVVVVEHEEEILRRSDMLVEIGPGAGRGGGQIVFQGTPAEAQEREDSLTGAWLAGKRGLGLGSRRRATTRGRLQLVRASGNNLKEISVDFPLGVLCLVTGVSGAGKSTLVNETLFPALVRLLRLDENQHRSNPPLEHEELLGAGQLDDVVLVDDTPIGRSPRSNPVTFVKAFDHIRRVFADQPEARSRGYTAGHFSFNVEGGRCEACGGDGLVKVDMQFMADVYMPCRECHGRRYRKDVLDVKYRGRSIAEVLDMTAREAFAFFRGQDKVLTKLKCLLDVGLDYLCLGQPATTLSTGEAQRLKLATYLGPGTRGRTLFLLDEPTTGLHFADVVKLLDCFDALVEVGHSLIIVEHNLQLMMAADWLIDLGPGAAEQGGRVVVCGTPEEVARCPTSRTGQFLSAALARREAAVAPTADGRQV